MVIELFILSSIGNLLLRIGIRGLVAFGCLVEALWMSFSCLFVTFSNVLAPFGRLWRAFLDPGTTPGPISGSGCKNLRKNYNLVEIVLPPGFPILDNFCNFDDLLAASFLLLFLIPIFLTICSSGVHLGFNL